MDTNEKFILEMKKIKNLIILLNYTIQGFMLDYLLSNITVGYQLTLLVMLTSAPCSISALTTLTFPQLAALCNGVFPSYIQNRTN